MRRINHEAYRLILNSVLVCTVVTAVPRGLAQDTAEADLAEIRNMLASQQDLISSQAEELSAQREELSAQRAMIEQMMADQGEAAVQASAAEAQAEAETELNAMIQQQQDQIAAQEARSADQAAALRDQRELIARQADTIDGQREVLLSLQTQIDQISGSTAEDDTEEEVALRQRLQTVESQLSEIPEDPMAALTDESFPGAWRIPGSTAAMRIGGYVKMNIVNSFDALATRDRFIVGTIPPEDVIVPGAEEEFAVTAAQSRLNFDLRDQTELGTLRAFVEGDFAGDGDTFRLRHAFGQFRQMLAGQTWSTLMDINSSPEEVDFEGINGRINVRQAQLRFFPQVAEDLNLRFSLEDPQPDVTNGEGVSELPDLVVSLDRVSLGGLDRFELFSGWNARVGLIGRQIKARPIEGVDGMGNVQLGDKESTTGWGITASGRTPWTWLGERDQFLWQLTYGEGIGRYINDLSTVGGQDAVFDPDGNLKALPVFAGYVSFQHWWREKWRSNLTLSWVDIDNFDFQPPEAYDRTWRGSINLIYSPVPRAELGTELLWGERQNKGLPSGDASQIQFSARYLF